MMMGVPVVLMQMACRPKPLPDHPLMIESFVGLDQIFSCDSQVIFFCPQKQDSVAWLRNVYSPDLYVTGDTSWIFFTARESSHANGGLARIGLAYRVGAQKFSILPQPILFADATINEQFPDEGGLSEPRVVEDDQGMYWMTYNAWQQGTPRISLARSSNLTTWTKLGVIREEPCVSATILTEQKLGRKIVKQMSGQYLMYWGDKVVRVQRSPNLRAWTSYKTPSGQEHIVFGPRWDQFDSEWVSPVSATWSSKGVLVFYNGGNKADGLVGNSYGIGQVVLDPHDGLTPRARAPIELKSESVNDGGHAHPMSTGVGKIGTSHMLLMGTDEGGVFWSHLSNE